MPDFDRGFKTVAHVSARQLAQVAGTVCSRLTPIVSEIQMSERLADRAFRARVGRERCVLYFEAFTEWNDDALWNLLAKSGLLSERERLPTRCLVFILRPGGGRPEGKEFRLSIGKKVTQLLSFQPVFLWEQVPQPWWDQSPGLMALYPLTRHPGGPEQAITHAADAIERGEKDVGRRAELLTVLGIFGTLVCPNFDSFDLIGRQRMNESPFYQHIMDDGRKELCRGHILDILKDRFGEATATQIRDTVNGVEDLAKLDELFHLSYRCREFEEFRAALPRPRRARSPRQSRKR